MITKKKIFHNHQMKCDQTLIQTGKKVTSTDGFIMAANIFIGIVFQFCTFFLAPYLDVNYISALDFLNGFFIVSDLKYLPFRDIMLYVRYIESK
jgi:hypothetical protein